MRPVPLLDPGGCAMLILIRENLLAGDFTVNMRLLQDYPISDVHTILTKPKSCRTTPNLFPSPPASCSDVVGGSSNITNIVMSNVSWRNR
ncbi:hypothetical protein INR49_023478 [Caranx melampygus]|nr:hypothetical protein INR49_023478 [Caranx melampygus]